MSNDLDDLSIEELKERKEQLEANDYGVSADHIDEALAEREEQRNQEKELLDLKIKLEQAKDAGLADDPTVERLQERVDALEDDLYPDPRAELAEAVDVEEEQLAGLSEEEVEQAKTHIEALSMFADSSGAGAETTIREHREGLEALVAGHDVEVEALTTVTNSDERGVAVSDLYDE